MHPAILYPRRSQIRPQMAGSDATPSLYAIDAELGQRSKVKRQKAKGKPARLILLRCHVEIPSWSRLPLMNWLSQKRAATFLALGMALTVTPSVAQVRPALPVPPTAGPTCRASGRCATVPPLISRITRRVMACPRDAASSREQPFRISRGPLRKSARTSRSAPRPIRSPSATCRVYRGSCTWSFRSRFFRRAITSRCCSNGSRFTASFIRTAAGRLRGSLSGWATRADAGKATR